MNLVKRFAEFVQVTKAGALAGYLAVGKEIVIDIQQRAPSLGRFKASRPGAMPNRRRQSGGLYGTLGAVQTATSALVTSRVRYAGVLERGGTIRPVNKRMLTVPINTAAMRFSEQKGLRSLRDYDFRLIISKKKGKGRALLVGGFTQKFQFYRTSRGKRIEVRDEGTPVFVLKPWVYIEKRPVFRPALDRFRGEKAWFAWSRVVQRQLQGRAFGVILKGPMA